MKIDFRAYAGRLALEGGRPLLQPVIEKEIVHYEILRSLASAGALNDLTFQGGTCLRLCYGSPRYSEDLDFAAGAAFSDLDLEGIAKTLEKDLLKSFDVTVRVKEPKAIEEFGCVGVRRWTVVVDTAPERPDFPSQRIKLEVASVPSHTHEIRQVILNYDELPASYGDILVMCQAQEEVLADKIISFANTEKHVRHRDLWDIPWLLSRSRLDFSRVPELVELKHANYGCDQPLQSLLERGAHRALEEIEGETFANQMRRFLPEDVYGRTAGNAQWISFAGARVADAYRRVSLELLPHEQRFLTVDGVPQNDD